MPGTAVTCWSPQDSDWVAHVIATLVCQEPPVLSSVAVNRARVLRAPLLTTPDSAKTSVIKRKNGAKGGREHAHRAAEKGEAPCPAQLGPLTPVREGNNHLNISTDTHRYRYSHTHGGRGIYGF